MLACTSVWGPTRWATTSGVLSLQFCQVRGEAELPDLSIIHAFVDVNGSGTVLPQGTITENRLHFKSGVGVLKFPT